MTDEVSKIQPFTTLIYTTKDGEKISATKNNGIVTLSGDKNGIRQMSSDEFSKYFLETAISLEKAPEKDTFEHSSDDAKSAQVSTSCFAATPDVQSADSGKKLDVAV